MKTDPVYSRPGLYDLVLPRYEFGGATDEEILRRRLEQIGRRFHNALEIGSGTGRMTRVLQSYTKQLTCLDSSLPMIQELSARLSGVRAVHADVRDHLVEVPDCSYDLVVACWSLNYPLLDCFESKVGSRIVQHDFSVGLSDAKFFMSELSRVLSPEGCILVLFFDSEAPEQRFVTDLWESVAPFPGTGRDFTRQLVVSHLAQLRGELNVAHRSGDMVAPDYDAAVRWFVSGHLKSFPGLADAPEVLAAVRTYLAEHQDVRGIVRVPTGMYLITYRHPREARRGSPGRR